jgi:hypothetical protein
MSGRRYSVRPSEEGVEVVEADTAATWNVLRDRGDGYIVVRTQRVSGTKGLSEIWDSETADEIERGLAGS